MKVTMIIGEPASGKSHLMKEFMRQEGPWSSEAIPYVAFHRNANDVRVIGRYDEEHKFPGTDRLSMACQPKVLELLGLWDSVGIPAVLFEGDRLGNMSMINALLEMRGIDFKVVCVVRDEESLQHTRATERKSQDARFVKSRHTKIQNIVKKGESWFRYSFNRSEYWPEITAEWLRRNRI